MLMDSPMLRSVYSRVKELLRITLSKYKTMNRRGEKRHRDIGIGEGRRQNIKGKHT